MLSGVNDRHMYVWLDVLRSGQSQLARTAPSSVRMESSDKAPVPLAEFSDHGELHQTPRVVLPFMGGKCGSE